MMSASLLANEGVRAAAVYQEEVASVNPNTDSLQGLSFVTAWPYYVKRQAVLCDGISDLVSLAARSALDIT